MSSEKKSFVLHVDSLVVLKKMSNEQAGIFIKAVLQYQEEETLPELPFGLDLVFELFVNQFKRDHEKYSKIIEKRKLAGSNGGKQKVANARFATNEKQVLAKPTNNDSVSDNVNDSDNVNVSVNESESVTVNEKVKKKSSSSTDEVNTNDYLKVYNDFLEKKIGASEHFSVAGRTALKKIRQYLEAQVKIKHPHMEGEELESQTLAAFNYLFVNFDKWDNFHKGQIKLQQIESNLLNIINSIKNGNPKDKQPVDAFKLATEAIALSRAAAKERASRNSQMP